MWVISKHREDISIIQTLIQEYYDLEPGFLIEHHQELLLLLENPTVYISRRALKHFVERRSEEMKHSCKEVVFEKLYFAIHHVAEIIQTYDYIAVDDEKIIYDKGYGADIKALIRIVTEVVDDHQEVKSIHFKKNKKAT